MLKCALTTLGCKVNQCETEALTDMMRSEGYEIVDFNSFADVYIINTCCVTAEGERKSRQIVRRALNYNKDALIAVTGCAAQHNPDSFASIEGVKIIVGNGKKQELPQIISDKLSGSFLTDMSRFDEYCEMPDALSEKTRAFIKIQDGCNNFCAYCIIPYVRGRERSRNMDSIVKQCRRLAEKGFKEIVLTGIHLSSYGREWAYKPGLADVVERVCEIEGIERVRLGSLEPKIITDEFLLRVTRHREFCRQYHLSLQSGCDGVLKRMNRHYTLDEYAEAVRKIRAVNPDAAVSTDIIVGFCGETDDEFNQTLAFVKKIGFAWVHVFPYSRREGTRAGADDVKKAVKARRAQELASLCQGIGREYRTQFVGLIKSVLCETNENGVQSGLTEEHITVEFPAECNENELASVRITGVTENGLSGVLI